jgi:hypothetical protein
MTNDLHPLLPRQNVPALRAPLVGGGTFDLGVDVLAAVDYVIANDYPARGEVTAIPGAAA